MPKPLSVITGASSGIGAEFAQRLAESDDLVLVARRKDRLDALAHALCARSDVQIEVFPADLGLEADTARLAERLRSERRLRLLVNNAGFGLKGRFWESPLEDQESMQRLHVMATLRLMHAALNNLVPRDTGGIINVASVAAFVRGPGSSGYGASKSWMAAFTEGVYLELQDIHSAVVVQALCPGFTYSEFHDRLGVARERVAPRSFWTSAQDVVDASLRGFAERKLFVTPGWRYRVLQALITKLPTGLRLKAEASGTKGRREEMVGR